MCFTKESTPTQQKAVSLMLTHFTRLCFQKDNVLLLALFWSRRTLVLFGEAAHIHASSGN